MVKRKKYTYKARGTGLGPAQAHNQQQKKMAGSDTTMKKRKKKVAEPWNPVIENLDELGYAKISKKLGDGRYQVVTVDGKTIMGKIRNAIRRFTRLEIGDAVMISYRDFDSDKVDIVHKYSPEDTRYLEKNGHMSWSKPVDEFAIEEDMNIVFEVEEEKDVDIDAI